MPTVLILVSIYLLIILEALLLWWLQHQLSELKKHEELMWERLEQAELRTKSLQNSLSELRMSHAKLWTSQDRVNYGQSEINRSVQKMLKNLTEQEQPHGES